MSESTGTAAAETTGPNGQASVEAVSYTHLDVYKRQLSTMAAGAHVCTTHVPLQLRAAGSKNSTNHTTARQGGLS